MGLLLARAERIDKLTAICVVCGEPATKNQRLIDGEPAPAEGPDDSGGGRRVLRGAVPGVPRGAETGSGAGGAVVGRGGRGTGEGVSRPAGQPPGTLTIGYTPPASSRSARNPQFAKPSSDCGSSRLKSRRRAAGRRAPTCRRGPG